MSDFQCIITMLTFLVSIVALYMAVVIPRKVMVDQLYAGLIADYRSPEMGGAILALFHFFVKECKENTKDIPEKYKEKYEEQIGKYLKSGQAIDFSHTLHFQRRLVAQFYCNMAEIHYKCCLYNVKKRSWINFLHKMKICCSA